LNVSRSKVTFSVHVSSPFRTYKYVSIT